MGNVLYCSVLYLSRMYYNIYIPYMGVNAITEVIFIALFIYIYKLFNLVIIFEYKIKTTPNYCHIYNTGIVMT